MDYLGEDGTFGLVTGGPRLFDDIYLSFTLFPQFVFHLWHFQVQDVLSC